MALITKWYYYPILILLMGFFTLAGIIIVNEALRSLWLWLEYCPKHKYHYGKNTSGIKESDSCPECEGEAEATYIRGLLY